MVAGFGVPGPFSERVRSTASTSYAVDRYRHSVVESIEHENRNSEAQNWQIRSPRFRDHVEILA
jgi:hypothetical protein